MARKTVARGRTAGLNKSQMVRELKTANPKATAAELQAMLAKKKVSISLPGVYQALQKGKKKRVQKPTTNGSPDGRLLTLVGLVKELGIDGVRSALDTIERISRIK